MYSVTIKVELGFFSYQRYFKMLYQNFRKMSVCSPEIVSCGEMTKNFLEILIQNQVHRKASLASVSIVFNDYRNT